MCGIVAYTGICPALPILISGLKRLEYRGYDSAGIAVETKDQIVIRKSKGKVKELSGLLGEDETDLAESNCGIAHTRWATHGPPTTENAHPHAGGKNGIALVHNGIIENHRALRDKLTAAGYLFLSETDTEVLAHLVDSLYQGDLLDAVIAALKEESPDLIALTGDFIIQDQSSLPELFRELNVLSAPHGIIASPGNHDRWHCSQSLLLKTIEKSGVSYLANAGTTLSIKGEDVFIAGIDSIWGGTPDPSKTWSGHQRHQPVIALVHEPDAFDHLRLSHRIDLQLSGHTHGGQCRVPLIGYAPAKVKYGKNYIYGHYEKEQSQLWVGRGIGTVGLRVRFACSPELVILTLRSA